MKQKIINFINSLLLVNLIVFITLAPFSKKAVKISFIFAFLLWIIINVLEFKLSFYKHLIAKTPINIQLLFFLFALSLSTLFSLDPYYSHAVFFERYLGYILFFCLGGYLARNMRNTTILIGTVIFGGILIGVGGIWDHLNLGTEYCFYLGPGRLQTSFGQSISFPRFLVLYVPLSCSILFFARNKILKLGALVNTIFLLPCLIFNATRAGLVAVMISILIVSFVKNRKVTLLLLTFFWISFLLPALGIKERVLTLFNYLSWGERVPLWNMAIRMFKDYPVLGVGLGMHKKLLHQYWEASPLFTAFRIWHMHNTYLEILAEAGIVGISAFLWIFIRFFKHAFKTVKNIEGEQQAILLGLIGSVIAALILALSASNISAGVQETVMFWFLFGIAAGLASVKKEQIKDL